MGNLSTLAGGAAESGVTAGSSAGVAISDASTDTKGSWTQLIASTAYPTAWLGVQVGGSNSADSFLIDIGVGASTAEKVLIPDIMQDVVATSLVVNRAMLYPVYIPAGTRISARCASNTSGADTVNVAVQLIGAQLASIPSCGQVEGFGSNATGSTGTTIDPGGSANTKGSWTQLIASTAFPYRWMSLQINGNTIATTGWNALLDIGIGANPNEKVLMPDLFLTSSSTSDMPSPSSFSFPCFIPAGTRVSARLSSTVTTATERNVILTGQGVG